MAVTVPDVEKIASNYIRTATGARVVGEPTTNTMTAWVKVQQVPGGTSRHRSDYFSEFMVQCDCYAGATGGQPEANNLGFAVRKALMEMPDASHSGGAISGVEIIEDFRLPDPDVDEPPRQRKIVTALIYAHA